MPTIQYPDVPDYDGVPSIPRTATGSPEINISIKSQQEWINETSSELPWGIYTQANLPIYTPTEGGTLSVLTFGFTRSMHICDFPIEANDTNQGATFASYNKVFGPSNPIITYSMSGNDNEKVGFLTVLDDACSSTTIYNVFMPDAQYVAPTDGCAIERYSYQRTATHGATMLIVEVSLKQVSQVTAAYSNASSSRSSTTTSTANAKTPSAIPASSSGQVQPKTPSTGTLQKAWTWMKRTLGITPPSD